MKNLTLGFIGALIFIQSFHLTAKTHDGFNYQYSPIPAQQVFMQVNNINTVFRTDGIFNYDKETFPGGSAGFIWPAASSARMTLDFASGIWVGAKVGSQRELRIAACIYNSHYTPGNIPVIGQTPPASVCNDNSFRAYHVNITDQSLVKGGIRTKIAGGRTYTFTYDAWTNWPITKGAPYVEINNIPGYQPGWNSDRPGIGHTTARPDEISFMVYMDYTNCTNNLHMSDLTLPGGTLPLGIEIQQLSFAFFQPGLQDVIFMKWKIINKSSQQWDSTFISIADDSDIGNASDDALGCDSSKQMGFTYNFDNEDEGYYGPSPPALGYKILECPINYTGNNNDTAHLPYGNFPRYRLLKMSGYNILSLFGNSCETVPISIRAYNLMRGKDPCGNTIINPITGAPTTFRFNGLICPRIGWFDTISYDSRQILNIGPFRLNPGEERFIVASVIAARASDNLNSVCKVLEIGDGINYFYNQSFGGNPIGITQTSTEVPVRFVLYQNYPNPFNPVTKIKFALPPSPKGEGLGVRLIIYDILGREVTTLVNEELSPGIYEVEWPAPTGNGINYASGVYYYKLIANNFSETKKMLMVK